MYSSTSNTSYTARHILYTQIRISPLVGTFYLCRLPLQLCFGTCVKLRYCCICLIQGGPKSKKRRDTKTKIFILRFPHEWPVCSQICLVVAPTLLRKWWSILRAKRSGMPAFGFSSSVEDAQQNGLLRGRAEAKTPCSISVSFPSRDQPLPCVDRCRGGRHGVACFL